MVPEVELQRLHDLGVAEVEHLRPLLDQRHPGAESGEHRRVLDPDHPGADDHHASPGTCSRVRIWSESSTRIPSNSTMCRTGRRRAGGDHDLVRRQRPMRPRVPRCRPTACAGRGSDAAPAISSMWLRISWARIDLGLATDDVLQPGEQIGDRDLLLDPVARPVQVALLHPGQVEDGLAQGLGGDRAGVDADAADHALAVDRRRPCCRAWRP